MFEPFRFAVPTQMVNATLACSLSARVSNPKVFSGALIQAQRDLVELRLSDGSEIHSSREVLPQEQIRILVRATLPGTLRIAEIDFHVGGDSKVFVFRHL